MSLTKSDLIAIKNIVKGETDPIQSEIKRIDKRIGKLDHKFDSFFKFLDKDLSYFKKKVASKLNIGLSEFYPSTD